MKFVLRAVLIATLSAAIGGAAQPVRSGSYRRAAETSREMAKLSTEGPLQPLEGGPEEQQRVLQSLVRALDHVQRTQSQGDVYLKVITRSSSLLYQLMTEGAAEASHGGRTVRIPDRKTLLGPTTTRERWAFNAGKVRYERRIVPEPAAGSPLDIQPELAYDGTISCVYWRSRGEGTVRTGADPLLRLAEEPSSLTLTASGTRPFSEVLKSAGATCEGRQTIGDDECLKVSIPQGPGKAAIWISPVHGYRVRRSSYSPQVRGASGNYAVTEVDAFAQYGEQWFPTKGKKIVFRQSETGHKDWMSAQEWTLVSYKPEAADCLFQIQFPLGTRIIDLIQDRTYTVGGEVAEPAPADKAGQP